MLALKFTGRVRRFKIESSHSSPVVVRRSGWRTCARLGPQRNESSRALRLVAARVRQQRHPIQAGVGVEMAMG
jgi:hypothetical protein